MRLRLFHAVALLLCVTGIIGTKTSVQVNEDYRLRQKLPHRKIGALTGGGVEDLPPYKRVRMATVHYDYGEEGDPYQVKELKAELAGARQLFGGWYGFEIFDISIPITTSAQAQTYLEEKIASLYQDFSSPDDLVIIWYGGHGGYGGTWIIQTSPTNVVGVEWRSIDSNIIAPTGVDTFQIIDSCHAEGFLNDATLRGASAPSEWTGRGNLYVLSAATASRRAGTCAHAFSKAVLFTLTPEKNTEAMDFVPMNLFNAIPYPGMDYAIMTGRLEIIEASIKGWYGHSFYEYTAPKDQIDFYKIARLPCGSQ